MIWSIFILSLGLVSARSVSDVESEDLENVIEAEIARFEEGVERADNENILNYILRKIHSWASSITRTSRTNDRMLDFRTTIKIISEIFGNFSIVFTYKEHSPEKDVSEQSRSKQFFTRASHLGDILLSDEQSRQAINFNKYGVMRWVDGIVPYTIKTSDFTRSEVRKIEWAIADFNNRLSNGNKVQLVKRGNQRDYIKVISGNGCYSYLGRVGGEQVLSLQRDGCIYNATIQHEFMHAIGFTHEQNRHDRDDHVEVLWDNIPEDWHSQYEKADEEDFINIATYEHYSIMHYPWWAPGTPGYDAFYIKAENIDKYRLGGGENDGATELDVHKINILYS